MLLNLSHPGLHSCERLSVSNVIRHNDTVSTLVVAGSNCLEAFLASSVPDLELDGLAVNINGSDLEVNANSWHEVLSKEIILKIILKSIHQRLRSSYTTSN